MVQKGDVLRGVSFFVGAPSSCYSGREVDGPTGRYAIGEIARLKRNNSQLTAASS
jgi:hypothetical protein